MVLVKYWKGPLDEVIFFVPCRVGEGHVLTQRDILNKLCKELLHVYRVTCQVTKLWRLFVRFFINKETVDSTAWTSSVEILHIKSAHGQVRTGPSKIMTKFAKKLKFIKQGLHRTMTFFHHNTLDKPKVTIWMLNNLGLRIGPYFTLYELIYCIFVSPHRRLS